jgi:hypothetical protein
MLEKLTAVQPAVLTEECGPVTSSVVKFAVDSLLEGTGFSVPGGDGIFETVPFESTGRRRCLLSTRG